MKTTSVCQVAVLVMLLAGCGAGTVGLAGPEFSNGPQETSTPAPELPDGCPALFEGGQSPWVPAPPSTDTAGRLAPDADPVEALVCRYAPLTDEPAALDGKVSLTAGLAAIRHDLLLPEKLVGQNRACTAIGGPRLPHLMRLSYADGDLWVSAVQDANSCEDTGNGDFVSSAYLGGRLAQSYSNGTWTAAPSQQGCSGSGGGRLGQSQVMVPEGWESLRVCRPPAKGSPPEGREVEQSVAREVADLLNQVFTEPGSNSCAGTARTTYDLLFRYADGPPVALWYSPGCEPPLHNGSLDATPTKEQGAALEDLLAAP